MKKKIHIAGTKFGNAASSRDSSLMTFAQLRHYGPSEPSTYTFHGQAEFGVVESIGYIGVIPTKTLNWPAFPTMLLESTPKKRGCLIFRQPFFHNRASALQLTYQDSAAASSAGAAAGAASAATGVGSAGLSAFTRSYNFPR